MITTFKIYEQMKNNTDNYYEKYFIDKSILRNTINIIDEINKNTEKISLRKSNNLINNILANSKLAKFYITYYSKLNMKIKHLPINNYVFEYQPIFENLQRIYDESIEKKL